MCTLDTTLPRLASGSAPPFVMPAIDLRHLLRMTDDTGLFQHARYALPDPEHGYCLDDNARGLVAALLEARLRKSEDCRLPLRLYLAFVAHALDEKTRYFRNFMGYDRRWLEKVGSGDSHGRGIWALGLAVRLGGTADVRDLCTALLLTVLETVRQFDSPRSQALVLIGLDEALQCGCDHGAMQVVRDVLAEQLFDQLSRNGDDEWPWWEDVVTYDNAKLPHALLVSGAAMGRAEMVEAALNSLTWLLDVQTVPEGHLSIIGCDGWMSRDGNRSRFDQQPLEAYSLIHACVAAARITGQEEWSGIARRCFEWFRGVNDCKLPLVDPETGGCGDGLCPERINRNQGAESTLAYVLSILELHEDQARRNHILSPLPQK